MNKVKKICASISATILMALFVQGITSCQNKFDISSEKDHNLSSVTDKENGWFETQMTIVSEGLDIPSLRALTPEGENEFTQDRVRMLVFDKDKNFHYEAKVVKVEPSNNPDDRKGKGKLTLMAKNSKVGDTSTFVLLTNVDGALTPTLTEGMALEDVLKLFTFDLPNAAGWADGKLPMWGMSDAVVVNHSNGTLPDLGIIHLVRAVTRVDVGLNMSKTTAGSSQFNEVANGIKYQTANGVEVEIKLTKVFAYNTNNKGRIAPMTEDPTIWDSTSRQAKKPSLPATTPTIIEKIDKTAQVVNNKLLLREIYLPEATNNPGEATHGANGTTLPESDDTNYLKRPFLVVGLIGADRSNPEKETFFRIDYLQRSGTEAAATYDYLPLLRNHRYMVNITNVNGPGFDTEEEAKQGPAANIMYNVVVWNESTMSNVQYDGQYMLGVSEDQLVYYNHAYTQSVTIRTDWPNGWHAEVTKGNDWINVNPTIGGKDMDVTVDISVDSNRADDADDRMGEVTITAGRMTWKIKVKQSTESLLALKIYDADGVTPITMLAFSGKEETKRIVIDYFPKDGDFSKVINIDDFTFTTISQNDGKVVYDITSKEMTDENDDFQSLTDMVKFIIKDDGKQAGQALILMQTEYNAIPFEDSDLKFQIKDENIPLFLLDGNEKGFYIKANTRYQLKLVNNNAEGRYGNTQQMQLIQSGFTINQIMDKRGSFSGEEMNFIPFDDFSDNYKRSYGFAEFELSSPNNLFPTKRFKIMLASGKIQPTSNCYMTRPRGIGVLIPVSRINEAKVFYDKNQDEYTNWAEQYALHGLQNSDKWEPELIWSDMEPMGTKPVNSDGTAGLKFIKRARESSGPSKYIYVLPGTDETKIGNALIGCRRMSDSKTIWSWHIWVVDQYPQLAEKWLDRNIGANKIAVSNTDPDVNAYGMQYHFGRKDPFPVIAHKGDGYGNLVDANGNDFKLIQLSPKDRVRLSMRESIEKPTSVVWDGSNWLKGSTKEKRIWYNLWGGEINDENNWDLDLHTTKTVFDPCPYGWKVPALGKESDWRNSSDSGVVTIPHTGRFFDGNLSNFTWWRTYYGLSTVYSNSTFEGARTIYYPNKDASPSLKNTYSRTMGRVIRCVANDAEGQYQDYLP